jgi:hypothetical protein
VNLIFGIGRGVYGLDAQAKQVTKLTCGVNMRT